MTKMQYLLFIFALCPVQLVAAGFSKSAAVKPALQLTDDDIKRSSDDHLVVGGELKISAQNYFFGKDDLFVTPHKFSLFFDSKTPGGSRVFARGVLLYTPTTNENQLDLTTGKSGSEESGYVEEMKLAFNIKNQVFMTLGKQKIKWGSGKFWNPTDFLNEKNRNPLVMEDDREGVPLIKVHIPLGITNFYLLGGPNDVEKAKDSLFASRIEVPLWSSFEVSLSAAGKKHEPMHYGADVSFSFFKTDLYCETSYVNDISVLKYHDDPNDPNNNDVYTSYYEKFHPLSKTVLGLNYELSYNSNDAATFVLEYFKNPEGYKKVEEYQYVIKEKRYNPFHLSSDYGMFALFLPKPWGANDFSFVLYNLANITDGSAMSRFSIINDALKDLVFELDTAYHYGDRAGELKLYDMKWAINLEAKMVF